MNSYISEIYELFEISSPESHDLLLLKRANFEHFIRFLPADTLSAFRDYQKLIPPGSLEGSDFPRWADHALRRLGLSQKEFCKIIEIDASRVSRFVNQKGNLRQDEVRKIRDYLLERLVGAGLLKY